MLKLKEAIIVDQIQAMKNKNAKKLSVLRMLLAAIKNEEIAKGKDLTDEEVQSIVIHQAKQLSEAIKDFIKGGRKDLIDKNQSEIDVLQTYLPKQMSEEELKQIVKKVLTDNNLIEVNQIGQAMNMVMKEVKGKANGNLVKDLVEGMLSK